MLKIHSKKAEGTMRASSLVAAVILVPALPAVIGPRRREIVVQQGTWRTHLSMDHWRACSPGTVPSRLDFELGGASFGDMRLSDHAARSTM